MTQMKDFRRIADESMANVNVRAELKEKTLVKLYRKPNTVRFLVPALAAASIMLILGIAFWPESPQSMPEDGSTEMGIMQLKTLSSPLGAPENSRFMAMDVNSWSFVSVEEARDAFGEGFLTPGNIPLGFELESITGTGTEDQVENVTLTYSESASSVDGLIRFITITQEKVASSWEYYGFEEVDLLGYTGYVSASEETAELHFFLGSVRYDVIGQLQKDQAIAIAKSMIQSTR